jgi:hypothetical protein
MVRADALDVGVEIYRYTLRHESSLTDRVVPGLCSAGWGTFGAWAASIAGPSESNCG